jgi:membrane protein DedA with SNARE-associated domain
MNLENFLELVLSFTGTFDARLLLVLFGICFIGEFNIATPYLLETIWMLLGYHLVTGVLTPLQLIILWLSSELGRQVGSLTLFYLSYAGSKPLSKLYRKYFKGSFSEKLVSNPVTNSRWFRNINLYSPFSIAIGRLFWLRIPITIFLGTQKKLKANMLGVLVASVIWDSFFIIPGLLGGAVEVEPFSMILYSVIGLTSLYVLTFVIRRLVTRRSKKQPPENASESV